MPAAITNYYDDGYKKQPGMDEVARDAVYDATDSMSDKKLENLEENLRKSQGQ